MKIAIHHNPDSFSVRWIDYCKKQRIECKVVNAYDNDIIKQVADCDAFMWHFYQGDYRDMLFARQLIYSLQAKGIVCFPDFSTSWHFDDKVGQKYLLEAVGAPLVPSYVFYTKKDAMSWISNTSFPKVFKLRGGASSANVKLAYNINDAKKLVSRAFSKGFSQYDGWGSLRERFREWREGKSGFQNVLGGIVRLFLPTEYAKMHGAEKGYAYFQDYIPNNTFDIRVIVIADKAFAIKRMVRKNDFRASGSGNIRYNKIEMPEECVKKSFKLAKDLKTQSLAIDFVFDEQENPLIVEISYGFATPVYDNCPGYWTADMNWHEEAFRPQEWMVDCLIQQIEKRSH